MSNRVMVQQQLAHTRRSTEAKVGRGAVRAFGAVAFGKALLQRKIFGVQQQLCTVAFHIQTRTLFLQTAPQDPRFLSFWSDCASRKKGHMASMYSELRAREFAQGDLFQENGAQDSQTLWAHHVTTSDGNCIWPVIFYSWERSSSQRVESYQETNPLPSTLSR